MEVALKLTHTGNSRPSCAQAMLALGARAALLSGVMGTRGDSRSPLLGTVLIG